MSRLLPERPFDVRWCGLTRILVLSDQLLAEHWPAGVSPRRLLAKLDWAGNDAVSLAAALSALMEQLPATRWQRVEIYLVDRHAHLLLLPAMAHSLQTFSWSGEDQLAYARAVLMQTYGEAAGRWPFRLQDIRQPQDCLLAALPALHSVELRTLLMGKAIQWSVQPYATALWARTRLPESGSVLTAESNMLRLLQLHQGRITHIASLTADLFDTAAITAWLLRERTLLGVQNSPCYWLMEPDCKLMAVTGGRLKQALSAAVSLQTLYAARAVTTLWQEVKHVV